MSLANLREKLNKLKMQREQPRSNRDADTEELTDTLDHRLWVKKIDQLGNPATEWLIYTNYVLQCVHFESDKSREDFILSMYGKAVKAVGSHGAKCESYARLFVNYANFVSQIDEDDARDLFYTARSNLRRFAIVHVFSAQFEFQNGNKDKCRKILEKAYEMNAEPVEILDLANKKFLLGHQQLISDEELTNLTGPKPTTTQITQDLSESRLTGMNVSLDSGISVLSGRSESTENMTDRSLKLDISRKSRSTLRSVSNSSDDTAPLGVNLDEAFTRPSARKGPAPANTVSRSNLIKPVPARRELIVSNNESHNNAGAFPLTSKSTGGSTTESSSGMPNDHSPTEVCFNYPVKRKKERSGTSSDECDTVPLSFDSNCGQYDRPLRSSHSTPDCKNPSLMSVTLRKRRFVGQARRTLETVKEGSQKQFTGPLHTPAQHEEHTDGGMLPPMPDMDSSRTQEMHTSFTHPLDTSSRSTTSTLTNSRVTQLSSADVSAQRTLTTDTSFSRKNGDDAPPLIVEPPFLQTPERGPQRQHPEPVRREATTGPTLQPPPAAIQHTATPAVPPALTPTPAPAPVMTQTPAQVMTQTPAQVMTQTPAQVMTQTPAPSQTPAPAPPVLSQTPAPHQPPAPAPAPAPAPLPAPTLAPAPVHHQLSVPPPAPLEPASTPFTPNAKQQISYINGRPYTVLNCIGRGGTSSVYEVIDDDNNMRAVKMIDMAGADEATVLSYRNEIALLQRLQKSDRVITMFDHEFNKRKNSLYVVMERGDTDLATVFARNKKLNEIKIMYYWQEMLEAVQVLHQEGIVHTDLKPANFLLVAGHLKLIDFGIAKAIQQDMTSVTTDQLVGTLNFMSPEALMADSAGDEVDTCGQLKRKHKIGYKSDVWSLGCILYRMVYGCTPFQTIRNQLQKMKAIINPNHAIKFPQIHDRYLWDVIKLCLIRNPTERPAIEDLLQHPYLTKSQTATPPPQPNTQAAFLRLMQQFAAASPGSFSSVQQNAQGFLAEMQGSSKLQENPTSSQVKRSKPNIRQIARAPLAPVDPNEHQN